MKCTFELVPQVHGTQHSTIFNATVNNVKCAYLYVNRLSCSFSWLVRNCSDATTHVHPNWLHYSRNPQSASCCFLWKVDVKLLTRKKNHKCNHFNRILLGNKSQSVYLQFVMYIYSLGVVVWQECEASQIMTGGRKW